jgi:hypothetical protein
MFVHVEWDWYSLDVWDTPGTLGLRLGLDVVANGAVVARVRTVRDRDLTRAMAIAGEAGEWTLVRRKRRSYLVRSDDSVVLSHSGAGPRLFGRSYWHAQIDPSATPFEVALALGLWLGGYFMRTRLFFMPEMAALRQTVPPLSDW